MNRVSFAILFMGLVGCGESVKKVALPDTVPVTGSVMLDGSPLESAVVTFIPTGQTKGTDCVGVTDDSGNYTLTQLRGKEGAPPGEYRVVISQLKRGDGTAVVPTGEDNKAEGTEGIAVESVPPRYSSMAESTLKAVVPDDGGEFPFELKSK